MNKNVTSDTVAEALFEALVDGKTDQLVETLLAYKERFPRSYKRHLQRSEVRIG